MNGILAIVLVGVAVGYFCAMLTALWLVQWSVRTRIIKFFFYLGSCVGAWGVGWSVLIPPPGYYMGYTTMTWAIVFGIAQFVGIWAFDVNSVVELLMKAWDGRKSKPGVNESEGRENE